jgi:hypothetical protein
MLINLFISFAQEDREQLESLQAVGKNPEHELNFHDRSELEPVKDKAGNPIMQPPKSPASKLIREELKKLLDRATKMVILVGDNTCESRWVDWEIRTFFDKKKKYPGKIKNRIRAMRLKGCHNATLPKAISDLSVPVK